MRKKLKVTFTDLENIQLKGITDANYEEVYMKVKKALEQVHWYDKQVWEILESGTSISELSRKTNISYYSLYNTYRKVKTILKEVI